MDCTSIIAVAAAVTVLVGWEFWYAPKVAKQQAAQRALVAAASPTPAANTPPSPAAEPPSFQPAKPLPATEPAVAETITKSSTPSADYEFTNIGGGIEHVVLLKHDAEHDRQVT